MSIIPILILLFAAMWLIVIRPQRKRQQQARRTLNTLVPGAEVLTAGGLYGTVREVDEDDVRIEIAPDTVVRLARGAIAAVIEPDDDDDGLAELERVQLAAEEEIATAGDPGER